MLGRFKSWFMDRLFHFLGGVDEPFYTPLNALANLYLRWRNPEKLVHPGDKHPDKVFYIIRDVPDCVGLASWYDRVLGYVIRAKKKGWVPVVDPPVSTRPENGGWYDFFKGPSDIPVEEALQGRNVVFATEQAMIHKRYSKRNIVRRHIIAEEIPFSDEAEAFISPRLSALMADMPKPVVGVRFRGTDYRPCGSYIPTGHARVPEIGYFCEVVVNCLEKWNIPVDDGRHLYVMTEDEEALVEIIKRFPLCRYVKKERFSGKFEKYLVYQNLPTMTPRENNMMYLLEIAALVKCDYLIGGYNGGVLMALNLKDGDYRDVHILNTGVS